MDYTVYLPFCANDRQREIFRLHYGEGLSQRQVAKQLGMEQANLARTIRSVKYRAAKSDKYFHKDGMVQPGYKITGVSTLIDNQWIIVREDKEKITLDSLLESANEYLQELKGAGGKVAQPKIESRDTIQVIPIGDPHIGLYAWHNETGGGDFDTKIACQDLMRGFQMVLDSVPSCSECLIVNLGDYYHADNSENRTMRSGHALDVDSRYARVVDLGNRLMLSLVDAARRKHKAVKVISLPGNHDDHSGIMLSSLLDIYYDKDPRVTVCKSANQVRYHRWGKNLFGFTHGHSIKPAALGEIMAHDCPDQWGETLYRYWHTGHIHSHNSMDGRGWRWESHRTLAAQDAWSSGAGYRSARDIKGILYHKEFGEVHRSTIDIRAIRSKEHAMATD